MKYIYWTTIYYFKVSKNQTRSKLQTCIILAKLAVIRKFRLKWFHEIGPRPSAILSFQGGRRSSLELELNRYSARADSVKKIGHWSRFTLSQHSGVRYRNMDRVRNGSDSIKQNKFVKFTNKSLHKGRFVRNWSLKNTKSDFLSIMKYVAVSHMITKIDFNF
jgi:hypothetical protein